jgi:hypothetical protein
MLFVDRCDAKTVYFGFIRSIDGTSLGSPNNKAATQKFEFDFRYYNPYSGSPLKKSGVYVFKTADKDSHPFNHELSQIQVYRGKNMH